jgi:predicted enzyme related to lactoylglutathione lyase
MHWRSHRDVASVRQNAGILNDADLVAFVATTDISKARAFYADVVGLTLTEDTPFACVFDANGTSVRLTPVRDHTPAPFTVLGWNVVDIAATVRGLSGRGVAFQRFDGMEQDELGIWTTPGGDFVAWFKDPDDNVLSLTQYATE